MDRLRMYVYKYVCMYEYILSPSQVRHLAAGLSAGAESLDLFSSSSGPGLTLLPLPWHSTAVMTGYPQQLYEYPLRD